MKVFAINTLLVVLLAACTLRSAQTLQPCSTMSKEDISVLEAEFVLWQPCTLSEARERETASLNDDRQALKAASCYAVLLQQETDKTIQFEYAKRGLKPVKALLKKAPQSGLANYLAALLGGLKAERDEPLDGLRALPEIEQLALTAAVLNPDLDHGGPDRLLGELYLRAPKPPVSIGDSNKAVLHFRKAFELDRRYVPNRIGLAASLLAEDKPAEACEQLTLAFQEMPPESTNQIFWKKALELMKRLCSQQAAH